MTLNKIFAIYPQFQDINLCIVDNCNIFTFTATFANKITNN